MPGPCPPQTIRRDRWADHHAAGGAHRRSCRDAADVGGEARVPGSGAASRRSPPLQRGRRRARARRDPAPAGGAVAGGGDRRAGLDGETASGVDLRWAGAATARPADDEARQAGNARAVAGGRGRAWCARASAGVLIGSFQTERFYRQSERRWRELARTASIAVALADFSRAAPATRATRGGPDPPRPAARARMGGGRPRARRVGLPGRLGDPEPSELGRTASAGSRCCGRPSPRWRSPRSRSRRSWSRRSRRTRPERCNRPCSEAVAPSSPELRAAILQAHRMLSYLIEGRH